MRVRIFFTIFSLRRRWHNGDVSPEERKRRMQQIVDRQDAAARAFRNSAEALDAVEVGAGYARGGTEDALIGIADAIKGINRMLAASQKSRAAQREALDAIIAANQDLVTLLNDE